jgi:hypothetical protein
MTLCPNFIIVVLFPTLYLVKPYSYLIQILNIFLDWNTHLNCDLYDTLFTPCGVKRMSSICYEIKGDQFWSLHIIPTDLKESKR